MKTTERIDDAIQALVLVKKEHRVAIMITLAEFAITLTSQFSTIVSLIQ